MGKEISEGQAIEEGFSASSREANNLELAGKMQNLHMEEF
jgi:hypothetical protein